MNELAILGAGGHAKVIADIAEQCGWGNIVFFDDNKGYKIDEISFIEGDSQFLISQLSDFQGVIVAIGDNKTRYDMLDNLRKHSAPIVSIVHPTSYVSKYAKLEDGTAVMPGAVVNTGAIIGAGAILNTGCSIDHDCVLGSCVHISPGARLAGSVQINERSWVGIGATVNQGIIVGRDVTVGAGAAVISDVQAGLTVAGVPARPI